MIHKTTPTIVTTDSPQQHVLTLSDLARHNRVLKQQSCDDSTDAMNGSDDFDVSYDDQTITVVNTTDRWNLLTTHNAKFSSTMGISGDDEDYETPNLDTLPPATTTANDNNDDDDNDTIDAGSPTTTNSNCGRIGMTMSQVDSTRAFADCDSDYQL